MTLATTSAHADVRIVSKSLLAENIFFKALKFGLAPMVGSLLVAWIVASISQAAAASASRAFVESVGRMVSLVVPLVVTLFWRTTKAWRFVGLIWTAYVVVLCFLVGFVTGTSIVFNGWR